MPSRPLPPWLLYAIASLGSTPAMPGGTWIGIVYVAAPLGPTWNEPGVKPATVVCAWLTFAKARNATTTNTDRRTLIAASSFIRARAGLHSQGSKRRETFLQLFL